MAGLSELLPGLAVKQFAAVFSLAPGSHSPPGCTAFSLQMQDGSTLNWTPIPSNTILRYACPWNPRINLRQLTFATVTSNEWLILMLICYERKTLLFDWKSTADKFKRTAITSGFSLENLWSSRKLLMGSLYASPMKSLPRASRTRPTLVKAASLLKIYFP